MNKEEQKKFDALTKEVAELTAKNENQSKIIDDLNKENSRLTSLLSEDNGKGEDEQTSVKVGDKIELVKNVDHNNLIGHKGQITKVEGATVLADTEKSSRLRLHNDDYKVID